MKKILYILLSGVMGFSCSCDRTDDPGEFHDIPLLFTSLECGRDTIFTEDTTAIRAVATGHELEYHWYVEKGDLLGSGSEITFLATPCTVGTNLIYCKIYDGNGQYIEKHVAVTVL